MYKMNKLILILLAALTMTACVDRTFDEPEFDFQDPDLQVTTSIAALKSTHVIGQYETLEGDIIAGVVVANDKSGNFYETIVIADETGGIEVKINKRSLFNNFPVGRKVFVKLDGLVMGDYNELIQLGYASNDSGFVGIPNEYMDEFVVGGSLNNAFQVDTLALKDVDENYMSMLIAIKDVQFLEEELGGTYADSQFKVTTNRNMEDCFAREIIVRTSGYASFAAQPLPEGKGTVVAVLSRYRDDFQLYLRDTEDIDLSGDRCDEGDPGEIAFDKDFEDGTIYTGGWTTQVLTGSADWEPYVFSDEWFAKISNYDGSSNSASEAWLISPEVDLSTFDKPALTFQTACNYFGADLEIYVSNSYDGESSPAVNNWTQLAAPISNGEWAWVASGEIDLSAFQTEKVHVAFRYLGSDSDGKTWEVDDIKMIEGTGGSSTGVVFEDGFSNGLAAWNAYSVSGSQVWEHSTQYGNPDDCARISGYDGVSNANEDWLISPAIDLSDAGQAVLTFESAMNYTGNDLEVYLSSDYDGSGDPNGFTWEKINANLSSGQWEWTASGNVDLDDYLGGQMYFAFKFTSTDSESATWEVDNVVLSVEE